MGRGCGSRAAGHEVIVRLREDREIKVARESAAACRCGRGRGRGRWGMGADRRRRGAWMWTWAWRKWSGTAGGEEVAVVEAPVVEGARMGRAVWRCGCGSWCMMAWRGRRRGRAAGGEVVAFIEAVVLDVLAARRSMSSYGHVRICVYSDGEVRLPRSCSRMGRSRSRRWCC